jgi:hypothetical protein
MTLSEIIRKAIETGKLHGTITFDRLNELAVGSKLEPEDIERLMSALSDAGVNVVESEA